jgi:uncharacterized protein Smg (DUF494 family)
MQEKIMEILIYVLSELKKANKSIGEIDVGALEKKGYTPIEITAAFKWVVDSLTRGENDARQIARNSSSFRILNSAEKLAISSEAFGYLLQLHELRVISDIELELIIERSLLSGFEQIDPVEMQNIVSSVLSESEIRNAMQGKIVMYSNDSIH